MSNLHPFPLISIITVVLNQKDTLEKTIQSVLNQSYSHLEYLIIDGGSTDGSVEIIKKYSPSLSYWESKKDRGISHAMNKGITKAKGEIIGIIHSNDWLEKDAVKVIVETRNSCFFLEGVMYGNIYFWDKDDPYLVNSHIDPKLLKREMSIQHPATFISRSIYDKYGLFDENFKYAMDYEFLLRLYLKKAPFLKIDKILANMTASGYSDQNWIKAYLEGYHAKIKLGLPQITAFFLFIFLVIRKFIVISLKKIKLHNLVYFFKRKIKG